MNTQTEVILNRICRQTVEKKASEIYFLPGQTPFIRINGELKALTGEGVIAVSFINELLDIFLSSEEKEKMEKQREIIVVRSIGKIGNCQIDFYFQRRSATCRIKLLTQEITDLSELDLPEMVKDFTNLLKGIVFVTGPRDSGRSTLLISLLDHINKNQNKFITTIEEPIKSIMNGFKSLVEQREVGKDTKSFLSGLKYVRQRNVDVVMVSQVNSAEVMDEIFALAEAGSLVFAMMDTGSAVKTIKRVLHFYPGEKREDIRYFLSESLGGIIVSRLVPKIGGGRIRAMEIVSATPAVKTIIATGRLHQLNGVIQTTEDQNSISLEQYLADLVISGKILSEDAVKYCVNEDIFRSFLRR